MRSWKGLFAMDNLKPLRLPVLVFQGKRAKQTRKAEMSEFWNAGKEKRFDCDI